LETPLQIIIQGCRKQDVQCQQQLYKHFYPDMIKVCFRYASDADGAGSIYNNAMLRVFNNIHTYSEAGKLGGWIKAIVVNCCIDFCKKKNIFKNTVPVIDEAEVTIEPEVFDRVAYQEIVQVINQLPGATATVFRLFVYEGFTHKQIGEHLNISEGTSKWHVSEAKKLLKKKFEQHYENNFTVNATR
jgi:RNA polymerase sigma-70 factor (ECF subfamily)